MNNYGYEFINHYNAGLSPSTVHCKNTGLVNYYTRYLIQKVISVFEFSGIPEEWALNYFQYVLICRGYIGIIDTARYGIIPQECGLSGFDVFYQPNRITVANPLLDFKEMKIGTQCEVIKMQPDYGGILDLVGTYADLMALTSESIVANLINSKMAYVFGAEDKASAESLKKLYDQIASGEPAAFADKKLFNEDGSPSWVLFTQNLSQNYIGSKLLEDLAKIDSRFNTDIGIPNVNIAKASGVTDSEVRSNNVDTQSKCKIWLETIQNGLDKVSRMFGLNITAALRFEEEEVMDDGNSVPVDTDAN